MNIGVLGVQGDVSEHVDAVSKALKKIGEGKCFPVKNIHNFNCDALIIPGGESTAIKTITHGELIDILKEKDIPLMGTCAGLILLAKEVDGKKTNGILDIAVKRNAYGTQKDSFECDIDFKFSEKISKIHAVFIRAPVIDKVYNIDILAEFNNKPVAVKKNKILGLSFHPELTEDTRIYEFFLKEVAYKI